MSSHGFTATSSSSVSNSSSISSRRPVQRQSGHGGSTGNGNSKNLSSSTLALVKDMIKDTPLTKFQQKQLEKSLEESGSLPQFVHPSSSRPDASDVSIQMKKQREAEIFGKKSYTAPKRKKLDQIVSEGAYEPDTHYRPLAPKFDRDKERERLAIINQFNGKPPRALIDPNWKPEPKAPPKRKKSRFQELVEEVEERREFLEEMRSLGQLSSAQERIILAEIAAKAREMEAIDAQERAKERA